MPVESASSSHVTSDINWFNLKIIAFHIACEPLELKVRSRYQNVGKLSTQNFF